MQGRIQAPPYNLAIERLITLNIDESFYEAILEFRPSCTLLQDAIREARALAPDVRLADRAAVLIGRLDPDRCAAFSELIRSVVAMRGGAATPVHIYERQYDDPTGPGSVLEDELATFGYPIVEEDAHGNATSTDGCWIRFTNSP